MYTYYLILLMFINFLFYFCNKNNRIVYYFHQNNKFKYYLLKYINIILIGTMFVYFRYFILNLLEKRNIH